eukprot:8272819-Pyramimonas_sp.AAC.1
MEGVSRVTATARGECPAASQSGGRRTRSQAIPDRPTQLREHDIPPDCVRRNSVSQNSPPVPRLFPPCALIIGGILATRGASVRGRFCWGSSRVQNSVPVNASAPWHIIPPLAFFV